MAQCCTCGLITECYRDVNNCLNFSKIKYLIYTGDLSVARYLLRCSSLLLFFFVASSNFRIHFGCYANAAIMLPTISSFSYLLHKVHFLICKMGTGFFPGVKCGRGVLLTLHPLPVPRSWKSRAIALPTL